MRQWNMRLGALVALIALLAAPAARAACAARCAGPANLTSTRPASAAPDATLRAGHQHAHHHGPQADAPATPAPAVAAAAAAGAVWDARSGPAGGRDCLVVRNTAAAPAGRALPHAVSMAALATSVSPVRLPAAAPPRHRTSRIRPPSPTAARLPLRI